MTRLTWMGAVVASTLAALANACPLEHTGGWGGFGTAPGQFNFAHHLDVNQRSGVVYVGDLLNNRVQYFSAAGSFLGSWALTQPDGVAVAPDSTVYVISGTTVRHFTATGTSLGSWGSLGSDPGLFDFPIDLAVDTDGFVYVVDSSNYRVQKFTSAGVYVSQFGTQGTGDGQFLFPIGIAVHPSGEIVVTDGQRHVVQFFTATGDFVRGWGEQGTGDGQFESVGKPAFDTAGNVVVPDGGNSRMQVYTLQGQFLCTWGSTGSGAEQLYHPTAIAGRDNSFVVMDKDNHRIVLLQETPTSVEPRSWSHVKSLLR